MPCQSKPLRCYAVEMKRVSMPLRARRYAVPAPCFALLCLLPSMPAQSNAFAVQCLAFARPCDADASSLLRNPKPRLSVTKPSQSIACHRLAFAIRCPALPQLTNASPSPCAPMPCQCWSVLCIAHAVHSLRCFAYAPRQYAQLAMWHTMMPAMIGDASRIALVIALLMSSMVVNSCLCPSGTLSLVAARVCPLRAALFFLAPAPPLRLADAPAAHAPVGDDGRQLAALYRVVNSALRPSRQLVQLGHAVPALQCHVFTSLAPPAGRPSGRTRHVRLCRAGIGHALDQRRRSKGGRRRELALGAWPPLHAVPPVWLDGFTALPADAARMACVRWDVLWVVAI